MKTLGLSSTKLCSFLFNVPQHTLRRPPWSSSSAMQDCEVNQARTQTGPGSPRRPLTSGAFFLQIYCTLHTPQKLGEKAIDFLSNLGSTRPRFNPIAPTLMKKGLQILLDNHFQGTNLNRPSKDILDMVVGSSNGDIRSAIMALQFACVVNIQVDKKGKKKAASSNRGTRVLLESVTRREQSLHLFHLIGKVLYNKREVFLRFS